MFGNTVQSVIIAVVYCYLLASMVGLRFGDQILQIDGKTVAGWDTEKAMEFLKKTSPEKITFAVRDRSVLWHIHLCVISVLVNL